MKTGKHKRTYFILEYTTLQGFQYRRSFPSLKSAYETKSYPYNERRRYFQVEETRIVAELPPHAQAAPHDAARFAKMEQRRP